MTRIRERFALNPIGRGKEATGVTSQNLRAISLRRILPSTSFVGCGDIAVTHATDRSDQCESGSLFAVISGTRHDGREFIGSAIAGGAQAVLVSEPLDNLDVPQCVVPNVREAYSRLCLALASCPDRSLTITGVTGTNGKTTVTWLLRSIFETAKFKTGVIGTVGYSAGSEMEPATLTTPGPARFAGLLREMVKKKTTHAFVELSSHALDQSRLGGLRLSSAIVTNVTQDHFDYHGGVNEYLTAKERIADYCAYGAPVVVNADDRGCQQLIQRWSRRKLVQFGLNPGADARGLILETHPDRTVVRFEILGEAFDCEIALPGRYNVSNCVAAATIGVLSGIAPDTIAEGLNRVAFVPGRLQPVNIGQPFRVFVDYAHTPDALAQVVSALRPTTPGRLFCVFGAGGDRDSAKRPLMGAAASAADVIVVTSDSPRSEEPAEIIRQIQEGIGTNETHVEVERGAAIDWAIRNARAGDCVLIAGKGHEKIQQIGDVSVPFDDGLVAAEAIGQHHIPKSDSRHRSREVSWTR
jgi:UDP-N-acetylmuramoyl-L-alanyl-D-glutamate--2,6-diaminopimelate ligase